MHVELTVYVAAGVLLIVLLLVSLWIRQGNNITPAESKAPKPKREPKPFAGYTCKPECELCEQAPLSHSPAPVAPPPHMIFTRGRPRQVETTGHFCPYDGCSYYGWVGFGNIRANGHPNGRRWRQLYCLSCHGYFLETVDTPFHAKQVDPDRLVWAITALAEGVGIRAVARIFETDPNTVLTWLVEAAEHLEAFSHYYLRDVYAEHIQMDELFALLSAVKEGEISEAKAIKRLSRSPYWVWAAMDPVSKLIVAWDVGPRSQAMAQRLVHHVTQVLAPDCAPLFLTDGFREYLKALVTHYGQWIQPERPHDKGRWPKPRWMPTPSLLYAQVVKSYRRRRIAGVKHRIVFGSREVIDSLLAKHGWKINTSFIERLNLDFRQHVAAIGRRVNTLCKHESGLRQQLAIFHAYHNFVLPHASLRLPLPDLGECDESGKRWQPRTPVMAARLTDRVWTMREVLMFRVPPWPQPLAS